MRYLTRRAFAGAAAAGAALIAAPKAFSSSSSAIDLVSMTTGARPITTAEHAARIAKLQSLMQREKVAALLVEAGSSLEYFTGIRWWRSERTTAALIPAEDKTIIVTPFFEVPSVEESLKIPADFRPWHEDQSPFELIAGALRGSGPLAVEWTTRHFIVDHVQKVPGFKRQIISGESLVNACRMIKSPVELALLQAANGVTINTLKHVHGRIETGMASPDIVHLLTETHTALGGKHEFALVLLNEASAYPHGTEKPQVVREGSVILIDAGCSVHGYQSDISRT